MSFRLWRKNGKVSTSNKQNVPELVKKYRSKYPELDRDLLRKLIRLENKIENPSELKKLDRCLRKSFIGQYDKKHDYSQLNPEFAPAVAATDWILDDFREKNGPEADDVKKIRDFFVKMGKAR